MLSDLRKKKMTNMFRAYDITGDGAFGKDDIEQGLAEHLTSLGVQPGTPEYERVREADMTIWDKIRDACNKEDDGRVMVDEYVAGMEKLMNNEEEFIPFLRILVQNYMDYRDTDKDGRITKEEYVTSFGSHYTNKEGLEEAFQKMDLDGDGYLTSEEVQQLTYEFHYSDNPEAPGNWMIGSLDQ